MNEDHSMCLLANYWALKIILRISKLAKGVRSESGLMGNDPCGYGRLLDFPRLSNISFSRVPPTVCPTSLSSPWHSSYTFPQQLFHIWSQLAPEGTGIHELPALEKQTPGSHPRPMKWKSGCDLAVFCFLEEKGEGLNVLAPAAFFKCLHLWMVSATLQITLAF